MEHLPPPAPSPAAVSPPAPSAAPPRLQAVYAAPLAHRLAPAPRAGTDAVSFLSPITSRFCGPHSTPATCPADLRLRCGTTPRPGLCVCCTGILQLMHRGRQLREDPEALLLDRRVSPPRKTVVRNKRENAHEQAAHNRSLRRGGCNHTLPNRAPWFPSPWGIQQNIVTDLNLKPPVRLPLPSTFILLVSPPSSLPPCLSC